MQAVTIVVTGVSAVDRDEFIRAVCRLDGAVLAEPAGAPARRPARGEFGSLRVGAETILCLCGVHGYDRSGVAEEARRPEALGALVLLDSCRPVQLAPAAALVGCIGAELPCAVVALGQEDPACLPLPYTRRRLAMPQAMPLIPLRRGDRAGVKAALLSLLSYADCPAEAARVSEG